MFTYYPHTWFITARIRRMGKVIVSLCLSVHTRGYLPWPNGVSTLARSRQGVPTLAGGYLPWLGPDGGVPILAGGYPKVATPHPGQVRIHPSQVRDGGYPKVGTPPGQGRYPTLRPRTCYTAGGMPLMFTQEDFLILDIMLCILWNPSQ